MEDELTRREERGLQWLPTWPGTAALQQDTSVGPCGPFLLLLATLDGFDNKQQPWGVLEILLITKHLFSLQLHQGLAEHLNIKYS